MWFIVRLPHADEGILAGALPPPRALRRLRPLESPLGGEGDVWESMIHQTQNSPPQPHKKSPPTQRPKAHHLMKCERAARHRRVALSHFGGGGGTLSPHKKNYPMKWNKNTPCEDAAALRRTAQAAPNALRSSTWSLEERWSGLSRELPWRSASYAV